MANILIIDDEPTICQFMTRAISRLDHDTTTAQTLQDGLTLAEKNAFDVVFLDVNLPDGNGLTILPSLRQTHSRPEVVILTGAGCLDGAETAITNGAWDYLHKPVSLQQLALCMKRILLYREQKELSAPDPVLLPRHGIIGDSPRIKECRLALGQAAHCDASVLITGETGTGKELFARAIHVNSKRQHKNFVVVDCASLPENLIESALFGHEKGAFTGADRAKIGLVKQADEGTLFLDEIGELPLSLQKSFLRVLQEQSFRPLGATQEIKSNFRLVAATHRNLDEMVQDGLFRQDLLYRLRSLTLELPPLRERQEDIKSLAINYLEKICAKYGIPTKELASDAMESLHAYHWPGNVRELVGCLESAISSALKEPIVFAKHLPVNLRLQIKKASMPGQSLEPPPVHPSSPPPIVSASAPWPSYRQFREKALDAAEKQYLEQLLKHTNGSLKEACTLAELGRTRLYTLLKKHGLNR
ncbi:MAG: sigma-54 dependent transcriptional regulator [Desulfobulbaceae bacterium]|nr:sigma-54 dependent transcriptional regulator [Desulfobulbaceae bacterium]